MVPETTHETRGSARSGAGAAVVYFAKVPVPGEVKTRLCPPLSPAEAAGLYRGFLTDLLRPVPEADATYCYGWPPDRLEELPAGDGVIVRAQRGGDLWARMTACFAELFAEGHRVVVIRNTDSPDLPPQRVAAAIRAAGEGRVVLGPDRGGGYYLIALASPCPELFVGAREGAATVFAHTASRARTIGLEVVALPVESDVDTFDDLLELWQGRARSGVTKPPGRRA